MFKKLALSIMLVTGLLICSASADEGDVLPSEQQACYETPTNDTVIRFANECPVDPSINQQSHFLNDEDAGKLSALSYITPNTAIIKLFSGISVGDFIKIHDDLRLLEDYTNLRDVTIVVRSGGGSAFDGMAIADLIKIYQDKGWIIRAEGHGMIASAAVPIFAQCSPSNAADGTFFMVHEAAMFKWPGRETQSDIRSQDAMMTLLGKRYIDLMVRNSTTSAEEWAKMIKKTTCMTADEAKATGIVDNML